MNYETYSKVNIQSVTFSEGMPRFLQQVNQMFHFNSFHVGIDFNVPCLVKNKITFLNSWFAIEKIVNFLNTMRNHTRQA